MDKQKRTRGTKRCTCEDKRRTQNKGFLRQEKQKQVMEWPHCEKNEKEGEKLSGEDDRKWQIIKRFSESKQKRCCGLLDTDHCEPMQSTCCSRRHKRKQSRGRCCGPGLMMTCHDAIADREEEEPFKCPEISLWQGRIQG